MPYLCVKLTQNNMKELNYMNVRKLPINKFDV